MGVAKVTLNGTTLIDVTGKTVTSSTMLSPTTALNKAGEGVTGNITTKSAADLTASGSTVTIPAGHYATQVTKNVDSGAATIVGRTITATPTIELSSSSGLITASYSGWGYVNPSITPGYISQGTSGVISTYGANTYQLPTAIGTAINTSTADQTISSYRWLTGEYTIRSVTTSNLTADNIKSGVTVKVGDAYNTSRITQVTGTYVGTVDPFQDVYYYLASRSRISAPQSIFSRMQEYASTINGTIPSCQFEGQEFYGGTIIFENAKSVGTQAFARATIGVGDALAGTLTLSFPKCTYIAVAAFAANNQLESIYAESCSYIGDHAFYSCRKLSTASFPNATAIGNYVFYYCHNLVSIYAPNLGSISYSTFYQCSNLNGVSFSKCTLIGSTAFWGCSSITLASFSICSTISASAFYNCIGLISADFPECSYIGSYVFQGCKSLINISFPKCSYIAGNAFFGCSALTNISFSKCLTISTYAFGNCYALSSAYLPICQIISSGAFQSCSSLQTISLPSCSQLGSSAFINCINLSAVYLLGSSIPTLYALASSIFKSTPITNSTYLGYYGSIYVPSSLADAYRTSASWSYLSSRIVGV